MKIVFFGTPEFAVKSLDAILAAGHEVVGVVTAPDRMGGRGNKLIESDIKKYSIEKGLKILQPDKLRSPEFLQELESLEADLFIVIAFRMLPEVVWKMPPLGTFNLHASLLPQLRGAAPINHAIISGFKTTGVTTFFINSEIDKGEILLSSSTSITEDDDASTLHDRLMEMGAKLVLDTIEGIKNKTLSPSPQPQVDHFTPAPKIYKQDCKIDFNQPANNICRLIRGLSPYPGAWCYIQLADGKEIEVKVLKARSEFISLGLEPGTCAIKNKTLLVSTTDGAVEIQQLQPAGKKPMDAKAFMAGYSPYKFF